MNKQSAFIIEESYQKIVKENEEEKHEELEKELKRKKNCERQRAYYHRLKEWKKNEEKYFILEKKRKANAERQRQYRQRRKIQMLCTNEENVVQGRKSKLQLIFAMDDDSSNDVVHVETTEETKLPLHAGTPMKQIFYTLIYNDGKENTVLTDSKILEILQKDLKLNVKNLHDLELDIYLSIMKKFLKEWPQWDEFDQIATEIKVKGNIKHMDQLLEAKCEELKSYINAKLTVAKPLAEEAVSGIKDRQNLKRNIVMQVHCSRAQLNQLFYRYPQTELQDNIFNVTETPPNKIQIGLPPLKAILNYWSVNIFINWKNLILVRNTLMHGLKHVLVNKKLGEPKTEVKPLDENLYEKVTGQAVPIKKQAVIDMLKECLSAQWYTQPQVKPMMDALLDIIIADLEPADDIINQSAVYRKNLSKYPYRRYLYTDTEPPNDKYDLQLEETIIPKYEISIRKFDDQNVLKDANSILNRIYVQCGECFVRYCGDNIESNLVNHFATHHYHEPDWFCVNCKEEFSMNNLCEHRWYHEC